MYKVVRTGTEDMGADGGQQYLGRVVPLDPSLRGAYCNNVVVSCMINSGPGEAAAFTVYLSTAGASGAGGTGWSEDAIINYKSTGSGGGTVSLSAKRKIFTDAFGSVGGGQIGPVHIWAEMTDTSSEDQEARFTIEAWGRFHNLESDIE